MALNPHSYPFAKILLAIRKRVHDAISSVTTIDIKSIMITASTDYPKRILEPFFVTIMPTGSVPVNPHDGTVWLEIGGGRAARTVSRIVRVSVFTRVGIDVYGDDTYALTGQLPDSTVLDDPGLVHHFLAEEIILNALDNFQPLSENNKPLTIGPIHWAPLSLEVQGRVVDEGILRPERVPIGTDRYTRSVLSFQVVYLSPIDSSLTAPEILP